MPIMNKFPLAILAAAVTQVYGQYYGLYGDADAACDSVCTDYYYATPRYYCCNDWYTSAWGWVLWIAIILAICISIFVIIWCCMNSRTDPVAGPIYDARVPQPPPDQVYVITSQNGQATMQPATTTNGVTVIQQPVQGQEPVTGTPVGVPVAEGTANSTQPLVQS